MRSYGDPLKWTPEEFLIRAYNARRGPYDGENTPMPAAIANLVGVVEDVDHADAPLGLADSRHRKPRTIPALNWSIGGSSPLFAKPRR